MSLEAALLWGPCRILAVLALIPLACCPAGICELAAPNPTVQLPQDESAHCYGGEWWYYTGRLTTDDGESYGVETVIFHAPGLSLLFGGDNYEANLAFLNESTQVFTTDQTRTLVPQAGATTTPDGVQIDTPLIQMTLNNGHDRVQAATSSGQYRLDLSLTDERGPVLHGGSGYVDYGLGGHSFYYSRPRMMAAGTLTVDGRPLAVSGLLWFDRQWGHDLVNPLVAWDWFSLRLDDGSSVMLYTFRDILDRSRTLSLGTYVPATGDPVTLAAEDFTVTPTAWWTSPHTGRTYPVAWTIQLRAQALALTVQAAALDQEFDARATVFNVYWEGLCHITGTQDGQPVTGDAYAELVNY